MVINVGALNPAIWPWWERDISPSFPSAGLPEC
jgi:hypothetical protein